MSLDQRLYGFLFDPAAGVQIEIVHSLFDSAERSVLERSGASEPQWRALATQKLNQISAIEQIQLRDFEGDITKKLALLKLEEWRVLGLGVALLPYVGRIVRSMDGHFRRGIRTLLSESHIEALDALAQDPNALGAKPQFLAPSTVWKNIDLVQTGGINAILEQVCSWPNAVSDRVMWKFTQAEKQVGPLVTGIQPQHIDVLCKTLLPNHPWLLSSSQTH